MTPQAPKVAGDGPFVGIDFGTLTSRVVFARGESAGFLRDFSGETAIPSVLAISPHGGVLAGSGARERQTVFAQETLIGPKRLLTQSREELAALGPFFPQSLDSTPAPVVQLDLGGRKRSSLELIALYLAYLRRTTEIMREQPIRSAVLSVPVAFNGFDRQALRLAALLAGFRRVRFIDDPVAAALAWSQNGGRGRAAVCSWGAHYFSVAITEVDAEILRVRQALGTAGIGGLDLDATIARDLFAKAAAAHGRPFVNEPQIARWSQSAAEKIKREVFARGRSEAQTTIGGAPFRQAYARADLEPRLAPMLARAVAVCTDSIDNAGLRRGDFDTVILAGGMTRIVPVRDAIAETFGCRPFEELDPEEAVSLGTLARARTLDRLGGAPLALDSLTTAPGIESQSGQLTAILDRNIAIPASKVETFTTYLDQQTEVGVQLYAQQESGWLPFAQIEIEKISPMKAGQPTIEVRFAVDEDGVLEAEAREVQRNRPLELELRPHRGFGSRQAAAIAAAIPPAAEEDFAGALLQSVRERATFLLKAVRESARRYPAMMTRDERQILTKKGNEMEEVLDGGDLTEIRETLRELEEIAQPLKTKILDSSLPTLLE